MWETLYALKEIGRSHFFRQWMYEWMPKKNIAWKVIQKSFQVFHIYVDWIAFFFLSTYLCTYVQYTYIIMISRRNPFYQSILKISFSKTESGTKWFLLTNCRKEAKKNVIVRFGAKDFIKFFFAIFSFHTCALEAIVNSKLSFYKYKLNIRQKSNSISEKTRDFC